jgi:tRNA(Ile)-lysidine synthase
MPYENAKSKYNSALSSFSMLKGLNSVLVGFSGGSDSALLLTLLSRTEGITVAAAHLNHGIRGDEALRDEKFCIDFCSKLGVKIFIRHSDVPKIASTQGLTVEEAARNERYEFFNDIAKSHSFDAIATAHNSDDNAETTIFNLIRGTSINGLCGIPPKRDNIIRPLILLTKDEIISACNAEGIPFVCDSTNNNTEYTRNYIRHEIIPRLKHVNPAASGTIFTCNSSLRSIKEYLYTESEKHSFSDGRASLAGLQDALLSAVISNELSKHDIDYSSKHIEDCIKAIRSPSAHVSISIPSTTFICDRDSVYLSSSKSDYTITYQLKYGFNELSSNNAFFVGNDEKYINTLKNIYKLSIQVSVNSDKIDCGCLIRYRKNADTYKINGMTKKVKKLIQSLKLPSIYTDSIPFICKDDDILYIPHFEPSDLIKAKDKLKETVDIYYFYGKEQ